MRIVASLLRTCDAVGACMAVPRRPWVPDALNHGNTLRHLNVAVAGSLVLYKLAGLC
ncbi:hypothetical protein OG874_03285 [Nocardia sp. NBC_00565]|uniref:hypothetical protein n=1 Tax=Nocardia sp. NBC_00565 TaxID=2975993 RepID=UPI002E8020FC|nr:hypothetical protein [Nocardia sp. NBC_00565]WUC04246.1 hypothetical protein OG874_03285 [Nocardia sp. NBC_00565]